MVASALGTATIGSTPFGLGTTADATVPPTRRIFAPYIDPSTGQCSVGEDGELEAMPVNRQRVMLLCLTQRGSSAVLPNLGTKMPAKIGGSFAQDVRAEVARALKPMTDAGEIVLDGVSVELPRTGRAQITVSYTDKQAGGEDRATFSV